MKSNFTNLANTYMYGDNARMNFTKKYLNNDQSIDDPIFTGFTLSIDDIHSPLFFTSGIDVGETLRNRSSDSADVAKKIEEHLKEVYVYTKGTPDTYEVTSHSIKDSIDINGNYYAGYGLRDMIYMDNTLYGAMDYIYMVDKIYEGNLTIDRDGDVMDLGNGTPNSSIYDEFSESIDNAMDEVITAMKNTNMGDSDGEDISNYTREQIIDIALKNMDDKLLDKEEEHKKNVEEANKLKDDYKKYIEDGGDYTELKEKYEKIINSDHLRDTSLDFKEMKQNLNDAWERYIENPLDDGLLEKMRELYNSFSEKYLGGKTSDAGNHVNFHLKDTDLPNIWETVKNNFQDNKGNAFDGFESIIGTIQNESEKVWGALKKDIDSITKSSADIETINDLKTQLDEKNKELYGVDEHGNPLTEQNASKNSIYGKYINASNKAKTDEYSQIKSERDLLEEAMSEEIQEELQKYNEHQREKSSVSMKPTKSIDIEKSVDNRVIEEVPQTIYDICGFISGMKKLTSEYPYILQSVTGLDEAYKTYFINKGEPHLGSGDNKITINCYESLDLRVSSMFNKYFNAVYDRQYKRERVPINLRRFTCSIFVHDIRNFRNSISMMPGNGTRFKEKEFGDDVRSKIIEIALNSMSAVEFKFFDCEIVPEETGSIFDNVNNESIGDMRRTNFTFTYGNCVINFLPFEDLNRYYNSDDSSLKSEIMNRYGDNGNEVSMESLDEDKKLINDYTELKHIETGDTRRWFDKSPLGNVNNNDYRDYIRHDSSVVVDDYYKSTIVNNFAEGSLWNKNKEITRLDDALRRMVMGISASTGIPVKGVTDALDIGFIDPIINKNSEGIPIITNLGNVSNSKVISTKNSEFIGEVIGNEHPTPKTVTDLGNINKK